MGAQAKSPLRSVKRSVRAARSEKKHAGTAMGLASRLLGRLWQGKADKEVAGDAAELSSRASPDEQALPAPAQAPHFNQGAFQQQVRHGALPPQAAAPAYSAFNGQDLDRLYSEYDQTLRDEEAGTLAQKSFTSHDLDRLYSEYDQTLKDEEVENSRPPSQRKGWPRQEFSAPGPEWRTPFADEVDLEIDSPDVAVIPAWARANP